MTKLFLVYESFSDEFVGTFETALWVTQTREEADQLADGYNRSIQISQQIFEEYGAASLKFEASKEYKLLSPLDQWHARNKFRTPDIQFMNDKEWENIRELADERKFAFVKEIELVSL